MSTNKNFSVQELLSFLQEFDSASPMEEQLIAQKHEKLGVREVLADAAQRYDDFWMLLGCIKVLESFEQLDKDSQSINSELGEERFSLESKPFLNQQSMPEKAFMAWHLLNTQNGTNEPVFTPDQCRGFLDKMSRAYEMELDEDQDVT
jgi:hypothetical protein